MAAKKHLRSRTPRTSHHCEVQIKPRDPPESTAVGSTILIDDNTMEDASVPAPKNHSQELDRIQIAKSSNFEVCPRQSVEEHLQKTSPLPNTQALETSSSARSIGRCCTAEELGLEPPVTSRVLQVLELPHMINNARLRHNLCFEERIEFRPMPTHDHACERRREAQRYFDALRGELEFFHSSQNRKTLNEHGTSPRRLIHMFNSIKGTLKGLCPPTEWQSVDQQLDSELLMQQIDHGVLDLAKLGEWLCELLTRSCAPLRDQFVRGIARTLDQASMEYDADLLLKGIKDLFAALELMKLDVANHQIRSLQVIMVEDYIAFGRNCALQKLKSPHLFNELVGAVTWFANLNLGENSTENPRSASYLSVFAQGIVDVVSERCDYVPFTLALDINRILDLRSQFRRLLSGIAVEQVFDDFTKSLPGWHSVDQASYQKSLGELLDLTNNATAQCQSGIECDHFFDHVSVQNISTSIAYIAYGLLTPTRKPTEETLAKVEKSLRFWSDTKHPGAAEKRLTTEHELANAVKRQIYPLISLTPLQIRERVKAYKDVKQGCDRQRVLDYVSCKIAHIAILQWRVWGPVLYEPCMRSSPQAMGALSAHLSRLDILGNE